MFPEDALKQILSDSADVSALVDNRIFNGFLSETVTYPAVAYRRIDAERDPTIDTPATATPSTRFVFFSVCKDPTNGFSPKRVALMVDRAIRVALQGFAGTVTVTALSPPESMAIQGIFFETASDQYDDRTRTHQAASVYDVRHSDSD